MENRRHFCTCGDLSCKLNPNSHAGGCDLCIKKNLNAKEIPSCFFKLVDDDISGLDDFSIESFAEFVVRHRK